MGSTGTHKKLFDENAYIRFSTPVETSVEYELKSQSGKQPQEEILTSCSRWLFNEFKVTFV